MRKKSDRSITIYTRPGYTLSSILFSFSFFFSEIFLGDEGGSATFIDDPLIPILWEIPLSYTIVFFSISPSQLYIAARINIIFDLEWVSKEASDYAGSRSLLYSLLASAIFFFFLVSLVFSQSSRGSGQIISRHHDVVRWKGKES